MRTLRDIARVIRSKNCSPFELTLDIILRDAADFHDLRQRGVISREGIAALYQVPVETVSPIIWFDPALAIKVVLRRPVSSGSPGDSDVYGAQQHAPLLTLDIGI